MTKIVVMEGEQFEELLEHTRHWIRRGFEELGVEISEEFDHAVAEIIAAINPARPATGLRLSIGGNMADTTLSVDVTGEKAVGEWIDDKGDVTTLVPNGPDGAPATLKYGTSDATVASVDAATGDLTFLKAGNVVVTADAVDSTGTALAGFSQSSVNLTLTPGAGASIQVSVEGAAPVTAPTIPPAVDPNAGAGAPPPAADPGVGPVTTP